MNVTHCGDSPCCDHDSSALSAQALVRLQQTAIESSANTIVLTDRQGCILWVNPAFTTLTGYSKDEVLGQNPRLLKSGWHDDMFYQHLWDTLLSAGVWHGEVVNRRKDGSLYTEEMSITPVVNEEGVISHFIAVKQDITARKNAE
ncbi:MAG: PAS domain S-box protein, partial [Planctomycetes bacterium]|nr:PAS domain S-box protein [Planctomycetota bacterium]